MKDNSLNLTVCDNYWVGDITRWSSACLSTVKHGHLNIVIWQSIDHHCETYRLLSILVFPDSMWTNRPPGLCTLPYCPTLLPAGHWNSTVATFFPRLMRVLIYLSSPSYPWITFRLHSITIDILGFTIHITCTRGSPWWKLSLSFSSHCCDYSAP